MPHLFDHYKIPTRYIHRPAEQGGIMIIEKISTQEVYTEVRNLIAR